MALKGKKEKKVAEGTHVSSASMIVGGGLGICSAAQFNCKMTSEGLPTAFVSVCLPCWPPHPPTQPGEMGDRGASSQCEKPFCALWLERSLVLLRAHSEMGICSSN